ncbi:MAG TPA: glycosyltransferase family 2 protein [Solirubrobacteraceae bacterium]
MGAYIRMRRARQTWLQRSLAAVGCLLLGLPHRGARQADSPRATSMLAIRFGEWWAARPRLLHAFVSIALCWTVAYLGWRIGFSLKGASPVLWAMLLLAELYGLWNLATLAWMSWELHSAPQPRFRPGMGEPWSVTPQPIPLRPAKEPTIDVYICTYDEPLHVLEATLAGCCLLSHPHITYVLDDGCREDVRRLAETWEARYITRPENSHAKAGNINHALTRTEGDLVLVLDADHVPLPDALQMLKRGFEDERLALVQSPHDFSNHDSVQHYGEGRHEQSLFFDVICPGKDRHEAAYWCGSGALIRRRALLEIGGVAVETIAEDFHTTIKLHRAGWRTRYERSTVLQGRAPHDLAAYLLQRDRWARGNLAVLTTPESPLKASELSWQQRLSYLSSLTGYLAGPMRLLLLATLAAVLWTGALPLKIAPLALAGLWAPATLLSMLAGTALCRGRQSSSESSHYELCTAEIFTRALRCVVKPGRMRFKVTPKEGVDHGGWEAVRQFKLLLTLAALLGLGELLRIATDLHAGPLPAMHGFAIWFVPLLGAFELRRVLRTLTLVARHRQLRNEYRAPLEVAAIVTPQTMGAMPASASPRAKRRPDADPAPISATPLLGRVCDVTASGIGFELATPLAPNAVATLSLQLPAMHGEGVQQISIEVEVRSCRGDGEIWRIGAVIADVSEQHRRWLIEYCHVIWPYLRLRGRPPQPGAYGELGRADSRRERMISTASGLLSIST